jgi:sulfatase modifying factor 1
MGIDTAAIRQFLFERFDDEELKHLCFDYFTDVYHDLTSGMRKSQMVQLLLEHCQEQGRLPALMAAMERERPELYATMFAPAADAPPPARTSERDPGQIFVSYAHQDSHFARRLAQDLRQQGLSVWIAPDSIRPGEKWVEAINRGLDESGVFVLALTPNAVESRWVKDETHVAIELNAEEKLRFMPLLVKPCDIPPLWRVHQQINFHNAYYSGLSELLATLGIEDFEPPDEDELSGLSALPAWARLAGVLALLVVCW